MRQDLHSRNIWKQLSLLLPPEAEQEADTAHKEINHLLAFF